MTKRDTAIMAVKAFTGYRLVLAFISLVTSVLILPGYIHYSSAAMRQNLEVGPLIAARLIPAVWTLIIAMLFWRWSSLIGARVFSGPESETLMETMGVRGWFATIALVLGIWLMINSLTSLSTGAYMVYHDLNRPEFLPVPSRGDLLDAINHLNSLLHGLIELVVGLCLVCIPFKVACWADRTRSTAGILRRDMALIGVKLIAVNLGFEALQFVLSVIGPDLMTLAMDSSNNHPEPFGFSGLLYGIGGCVVLMVPALLLWQFAPKIAGRLDHASRPAEPHTPQPAATEK